MTDTEPKRKPASKSFLRLLLFFLLNIAIVLYIAYREFGSGKKGIESITRLHVHPLFLVLALGCLGAAVFAETFKYRLMTDAAEGRKDPRGAFECAVLGKYYDNITPFGAGGQPFQIVYLKKRGVSSGASVAIPVTGFLTLQFSYLLLAAIVFLFNSRAAAGAPALRISAYIGYAFYLFVPACIVLFSYFPDAFGRMARGVLRFLGRLHLLRDPEKKSETVFSVLRQYTQSLRLIRDRRCLFPVLLAFSLVYQAALLSIPYFVLRAFGSLQNWWTVFSLVVYIYAAITVVPTPGNSGAAEGSFYLVFSSLAGGYLFWAMLVWRLLVYYGWLALGLAVLARSAVRSGRRPAG